MGPGGIVFSYCMLGALILGCVLGTIVEFIMLFYNGLQIFPLLGSLISLVGICVVMTRDRIKGHRFEIYSESFKLALIFGAIQFLFYLPIRFDDEYRITFALAAASFGQVTKCFLGYVISGDMEKFFENKAEKYQKYLFSYYQEQENALKKVADLIKSQAQTADRLEKIVALLGKCGYKNLQTAFSNSDSTRNRSLINTVQQNLLESGLDIVQDNMTISQIQKEIEWKLQYVHEKVEHFNRKCFDEKDFREVKLEYDRIPAIKEKRRVARHKIVLAIAILSAVAVIFVSATAIYGIKRLWNAHKIYTEVLMLQNQGRYIEANDMLESIQWYKDSEILIEEQKYDVEHEYLSMADVGDIVDFGECNNGLLNTNGPIQWIVLKKENEKTLLLSRDVLTSKQYNSRQENITWKDSTLREWLNQTFYTEVFSSKEQEWIEESQILNNDNETYGTPAGENTVDKVFLLSNDEIDEFRQSGNLKEVSEWWWLRSPGRTSDRAARVSTDGRVTLYERAFVTMSGGVRPAIWVK